ncbi:MAG: methyltransferase domain-containing protein [Lentisphaerae bacterium]|nr:methyltransferase domain-containing protein [Lentisphaerota bacterium]
MTRMLRKLLPPKIKDASYRACRKLYFATLPRRRVSLDRLLLGDEGGIAAERYARMTDNPLRPSTPIEKWPHVALLRLYDEIGDEALTPTRFHETDYAANARLCLDITGNYFRARTEDAILDVAKDFVGRYSSTEANDKRSSRKEPDMGHSPHGSPILVRPIRYSDCYQVIDGHHRAAIALARGEKSVDLAVVRPAELTPLQSLLLDVTWASGPRELYQLIESTEIVKGWTLVRKCTDRLQKMQAFLETHGPRPQTGASYIDIACNYGWFVGRMQALGYDVRGVERDPTACRLATLINGVDPERIIRSDVVRFLRGENKRFDVVSCLSLLHHFALGLGVIDPVTLIRHLDSLTGQVLFLDTGQNHEAWFRTSLPEWDADFIEQWLLCNTTFKRIIRLGVDEDNKPPYQGNYGRILFACVR